MIKASTIKATAGEKAEIEIREILSNAFPNEGILTNRIYGFDSSILHSSHEHDINLITSKHVYIIEVKSYKKITKHPINGSWSVEFHKTGTKERNRNGVKNSIMQNHSHKLKLEELLHNAILPEQLVAISVVITEDDGGLYNDFSNSSYQLNNPNEYLIDKDNLVNFILQKEKEPIQEINKYAIYETLDNISKTDTTPTPEQHIRYNHTLDSIIKAASKNTYYSNWSEHLSKTHECTCCHSRMFMKSNGNSIFWGCSKYPACKHTDAWANEMYDSLYNMSIS